MTKPAASGPRVRAQSSGGGEKVLYDLGSNNGDDLPYYLKKADRVVAVEANPQLCREIQVRFAAEIAAQRLSVEHCVVTAGEQPAEVFFYLAKHNHVLSQFPEPDEADLANFEKVLLPSRSILELIAHHGPPYYIKIDIEHYDEVILNALFAAGIHPPFISAECHSPDVFAALAGPGGYNAFKLVDGATVSTRYAQHPIRVNRKWERYSFPHHSAGPFGDDVEGRWLSAERFKVLLETEGLGWKDIHATSTVDADAPVGLRQAVGETIDSIARYLTR